VEPALVLETEVYADHCQFYLVDAEGVPRTDLVWDGSGLERHLGVADGVVAVGTVGYCDVPVRIEAWSDPPPTALDGWDHIVEASIALRSGRLALAWVEGRADSEPLELEPGTYRLRACWSGLDGADEMDGGDRYLIQLWPAEHGEPEVRRWWPPWDPAGVRPQPSTPSGRLLVGAAAEDARTRMAWLASGERRHLFRDADGVLWEHTNLPDAIGTPQLETLDAAEAERRYGPPEDWGRVAYVRPQARHVARDLWNAWRHSRRRRS
jgi:hypothetical protein